MQHGGMSRHLSPVRRHDEFLLAQLAAQTRLCRCCIPPGRSFPREGQGLGRSTYYRTRARRSEAAENLAEIFPAVLFDYVEDLNGRTKEMFPQRRSQPGCSRPVRPRGQNRVSRIDDHIEKGKVPPMPALAFDTEEIPAEHALDRISSEKRSRIVELSERENGFKARRFVCKFSTPHILEDRFVQAMTSIDRQSH